MAAPETSAAASCTIRENPGLFAPDPRHAAAGYDRFRRLEVTDSVIPGRRARAIIGMYAGILISVLEKTISMGNICAALTQSECLISLRSSVS
jgi:hypothetical protein